MRPSSACYHAADAASYILELLSAFRLNVDLRHSINRIEQFGSYAHALAGFYRYIEEYLHSSVELQAPKFYHRVVNKSEVSRLRWCSTRGG